MRVLRAGFCNKGLGCGVLGLREPVVFREEVVGYGIWLEIRNPKDLRLRCLRNL